MPLVEELARARIADAAGRAGHEIGPGIRHDESAPSSERPVTRATGR
jgi:hypothetical protein